MNLTTTKDQLDRTLARACHALGKNSSNPYFDTVRIRALDDGRVDLTVCDGLSALCADFAAPGASGSVCVHAADLRRIVGVSPPGPIDLSVQGETLRIVAAKRRFQLQTLDAEDYPKFSMTSTARHQALDAKVLAAVGQVAHAMSTDFTVPHCQGVRLLWTGKELDVAATDHHRIAQVRIPSRAKRDPVFLPNKTIPILRDLESVEITATEEQLYLRGEAILGTFMLPHGAFPPVENLEAVRGTARVADTALLLDALRALAATGGYWVRLATETDRILLAASGDNGRQATDEVPCETPSGEDSAWTCRVNSAYLVEALKECGEQCTLQSEGEMHPLGITGGAYRAWIAAMDPAVSR
jgi:DNA polymerase III subunit beta